jgi:tetratricopeptide (TPR) repeat protein
MNNMNAKDQAKHHDRRRRRLRANRLSAIALVLLLGGCASMPGGGQADGPMPAPLARLSAVADGPHGARSHLAQGMRELHQGKLDAAANYFNKGLKLDPQNANLNFLSALVYHLRAAGGDRTQGDLAEVGYRLALKFDPNHWLAAYQLGRLHWEQRRYGDAQDAFARALLAEPENARAAYGLAAASYAAGDPLTARVALGRLPPASARRSEVLRTRALVHAALGEDGAAQEDLRGYRSAGVPAEQARHLARRVSAWAALHERRDHLRLAQSSPYYPPAYPYGQEQAPGYPGGAGMPPAALPGPGLPPGAAPADAAGKPRGMVILEAVIIERENTATSHHGVNLLAGLSLQFGGSLVDYSRNRTRDLIADTTLSDEERGSVGLGITIPAITYSLNIANAADSSNRIVARPSVLAYDGAQSEMFIGSELTYTAQGNYGGSSFNKEIGLLLQVTPRFQPDGRLVLAARTEFGSAVPTAAPGTFKEALAIVKSRSSVTADMHIGQTLVIAAGTSSRETQLRDGVPVLRDVPLLQYLFSTRDRLAQETSLLILITPRLPAGTEDRPGAGAAASTDSPTLRELRERYGAWWTPTSNVLKALQGLRDLPVYREFRRGDVQLVDLEEPGAAGAAAAGRVGGLLRDLLQLIYY